MSSTPTADSKLNKLRDALYDQIDELSADEEAGGSSPVTRTDDADDAGAPPPPPAPKPKPAPAPAAAPPEEPAPARTEPEPSAEAPVAAAPEAGAAPAAVPGQPPAVDVLAGFDPQYANMLRKFAPGGKITTAEELVRAQAASANDYWRTQQRMAEQAQREREVPPPTPAEVPPPPELARFDNAIQVVVDRAKGFVANIDGWARERVRVLNEAHELTARRRSGDSTVDPDDIASKWARVHEIDGFIQGWNQKYLDQREKYDDLTARRGEVEMILDTRARLDYQAKRDAEQDRDFATQEFFADWSKALKKHAADMKVAPSRLAALERRARHATFFAATDKPIEDIDAFLKDVVSDFIQPIEEARQAGATDYTKNKAADAPKIPAPGKPVETDAAPVESRSPRDQLRDLEKRVMSDKAWEDMGPTP